MKKFITGFLCGAILCGVFSVFAVNSIYENPYKILVNGEEKYIQGYNVDDYSYFKLRDIANAVGGFTVDFQNDTIQISKDGYTYNNGIAYYTAREKTAWAPNYGKIFNVAELYGEDDFGLERNGANDVYHFLYPYNETLINTYADILKSLGFNMYVQEEDLQFEYLGSTYTSLKKGALVFEKDGNYLSLELETDSYFGNVLNLAIYYQKSPEQTCIEDQQFLGIIPRP